MSEAVVIPSWFVAIFSPDSFVEHLGILVKHPLTRDGWLHGRFKAAHGDGLTDNHLLTSKFRRHDSFSVTDNNGS